MKLKKIIEDHPYNKDKWEELKKNKNTHFELDTILLTKKTVEYYRHVINNVELDKSNKENSHIMWLCDKVDELNKNEPPNFVKGRVSLPDVDMDFESAGRQVIFEYVKERYGDKNVSQMLTFTRLQGRGALKDVMRANASASFDEMNRITSFIPDEAEISDQLQIMKEADKKSGGDGKASIIQWALENHVDDLKQWAFIDENGKIQGPMAYDFAQAIRIEGTKKSQSKHAAGVVISQNNLSEVCPMVYDKTTNESIAGMEMSDLEKMGHVKFDFLSVAYLDKIHNILNLLKFGKLR